MKKLIIIMLILLLTGCTSNNNEIIKVESNHDDEIISYFNEANEYIDNNDNIDLVNNRFITLIDFIFYDIQINNVKFSDLKIETRKQLLIITKDIDNKIESKWPNYKENIIDYSDKLNNELQNNIDNAIKRIDESLNSDKLEILTSEYSKTDEVNNEFNDIYNSAKNKIKNWYEKFRV